MSRALDIFLKEAKKYRENDDLVKSNLLFAYHMARKYYGAGVPIEDLTSSANIGLIKAAERFDETKGFKFISYAKWWIKAEIHRLIDDLNKIQVESLNLKVQESSNTEKIDLIWSDDKDFEFEDVSLFNTAKKILSDNEYKVIEDVFIHNKINECVNINVSSARVGQIKNEALKKMRETKFSTIESKPEPKVIVLEKVLVPQEKSTEKVKIKSRSDEILELASHGFNGSEIARELNLSKHTIDSHIKKIKIEMKANNITHAVAKYVRQMYKTTN